MHRVRWVEPDCRVGYALTWWATRVGENIYHHHGSGDHGFLRFVAFNKPDRFGVIALCNSTGHAATSMIAFEVLEMLVGAAPESVTPPPSKQVATPAEFKRYLGTYVPMHFSGELRVDFRDGALILAMPSTPSMPAPLPPVPLAPTHQAHVFTATKGRPAREQLTFELSESGQVTGFSMAELRYLRR